MPNKSVLVGQLRQIGTLWINYPAQFGAGKRDEFYYLGDPNTGSPLVVRGRLRELNARRDLPAGEITEASTHEWVCRFGSALSAVSKTSRWIIDSQTFIIDSFGLVDQKNRYYRFILKRER